MDSEGTGQTGLSTAERVAAAHPTCPLPATGSSLSRTQGPQVGPFHLELSRLAGVGMKRVLLPHGSAIFSCGSQAPSFLLPPPRSLAASAAHAVPLIAVHALSFLSVRLTFLLSCGSYLFHCPFSPGLSLLWGTL